jgi:hypothetical protein
MSTAPLSGFGEAPAAEPRRAIPFDVAFRYTLAGERGRVHREVVTVSIEGSFVAVSIGYGVVPEVAARTFGLPARLAPRFRHHSHARRPHRRPGGGARR